MTSVLIGIPTLNGPDRLCRVLESIERHTPSAPYGIKVLVCDDGSTQENLDRNKQVLALDQVKRLKDQCGLEMWMNRERKGIAASWNTLVRFGAPNWVPEVCVLLNDDVEVVDDWLAPLVYSVTQNPHVGMVGLNAYYGLMKSQIATLNPGVPDHIARPRIDFHESALRGGGTLLSSQGYAFAFRREAFIRVGGFDERYKCFFEELDFGIAMRRAGLFHYTLSYPIIFHMGGATTSDPKNMNASEDMQRSREAFLNKWGKSINDLRDELRAQPPPSFEWNTQLRNWS